MNIETAKTKTKKYYSLLTLVDDNWCIQFGDYDREVVEDERDEYKENGETTKIIVTNDDQASINEKVVQLNQIIFAQKQEEKIIDSLITELLSHNVQISVFDGEEYPIMKSTNKADIIAAMRATDEETLDIHFSNGAFAGVWLIYGNGPEIISNYSDKLEPFIAKMLKKVDVYMGDEDTKDINEAKVADVEPMSENGFVVVRFTHAEEKYSMAACLEADIEALTVKKSDSGMTWGNCGDSNSEAFEVFGQEAAIEWFFKQIEGHVAII